MTSTFSWILAVFLLLGSFSVDSYCLRGDTDLVAREDAEVLVREEDPINMTAARATRGPRRKPSLSGAAIVASSFPFIQPFTSFGGRFTSAAKTRQLHLSTVLRV